MLSKKIMQTSNIYIDNANVNLQIVIIIIANESIENCKEHNEEKDSVWREKKGKMLWRKEQILKPRLTESTADTEDAQVHKIW
jgi:hypothetical protein